MSPTVEEILSRFPSLSLVKNGTKVHCSLTGHEMPSKVETLQSYVNGKKFSKLHQQEGYDFTKHEPHIAMNKEEGDESKDHQNQLYCNLTQRYVNRIAEHLERHVAGKRFKRELKRYEECERNGKEYKPRRKPHKKIEKDAQSARIADHLQNELDLIASDNEEEQQESDDSLRDLYPDEDFSEEVFADNSNNPAAGTKVLSETSQKKMPRINSSKSKKGRHNTHHGSSSLRRKRGLQQPNGNSTTKNTKYQKRLK